jgi:hypothetical protein
MAKYVDPTPACDGGVDGLAWRYYFAKEAGTEHYVLIIKDLKNAARAPCIHRVPYEFVVEHEKCVGSRRVEAQDLAIECVRDSN